MPTPDIPRLNGQFLASWETPILHSANRYLSHQATDAKEVRPELILGEGNLLPFHFLRTGDRLGRAVVKIRRADGATGTGFLVAPDIILTNNHVLPDMATAARAQAMANFEDVPPGETYAPRSVEVALAPNRLFVTQLNLDFTFCGVIGLEGQGTIPLARDSLTVGPAEVVNIIQHPRGRPKEIAIQDNQVVKANRVVVHYVCDTEPGSSGSPVFDNRWRLVALHHASITTDQDGGGRPAKGAFDADARFLNEGIRLSAIALWLETSEAEGLAEPAALARLRGLFHGVDPQAGFFGALGRSARGETAAEIVASSGTPGAEVLDIAYWNLRDLAPRLLDHLDDLGQIVAKIGMDVWCFSHVSPIGLRALADHLDTAFRLEYRDLPGPEGESVAMLLRRSRTLDAERLPGGMARVRVTTAANQSATFQLQFLPDSGPSAVLDAIESLGPGVAGDSLLIGGTAAWIGSEDLRELRSRGLNILVADASNDGGVVIVCAPRGSAVVKTYISPNARSVDKALRVVRDRRMPEEALALAGFAPIAMRIVLSEA